MPTLAVSVGLCVKETFWHTSRWSTDVNLMVAPVENNHQWLRVPPDFHLCVILCWMYYFLFHDYAHVFHLCPVVFPTLMCSTCVSTVPPLVSTILLCITCVVISISKCVSTVFDFVFVTVRLIGFFFFFFCSKPFHGFDPCLPFNM